MYNSPRRRGGSNRLAEIHARQVPAEDHKGSYRDFLRRHRSESAIASRGTNRQKAAFAECLCRRTADSRNLKCAIDYLASECGTAPGPNGLNFEELDESERWQLARVIGKALARGEYRPGPELKIEIPKSSGHGTRTLRIQNIEDRVVQRAVVQVIQPLLEPTFARTSFGYRPGLGREHALALASHYAETDDRWCWILDDIRDAFNHVPHHRLLQILKQRLPNTNLAALVSIVIENRENRGLRQGGSLSPLLLNVYLDQVLDRPWAKSRSDVPLIRYADDLLALTRDQDQAAGAHAHLRSLLTPAGMPLKGDSQTALHDLRTGESIQWIGYRLRIGRDGLEVTPGEKSWNALQTNLELAHTKPDSPIRAIETIEGWIEQQGPCRPFLDLREFHARIAALATGLAFAEHPSVEQVKYLLDRAYTRWETSQRGTLLQEPAG
jgi:hypothetical protein